MTDGQHDKVTIQDVALRAGVSAMTVSRVLNNSVRVAPETRKRVEQAIEELGYLPNALASGLLKGRTSTIGLIVSDISNPFFTMVVRGVEDTAQRNSYTVFIGNSDESVEKERQYVTALLGKRIDGLLIAPASDASRETLEMVRRRGCPFVLVDRDVAGITADSVIGDNVGGAYTLTRHLLELGHTRIALVNGQPSVRTARDRRRGYEKALLEYGLEPDPALIVETGYHRAGGQQAAHHLLSLPAAVRPTAIFACNNFLAVGVVEALRAAQLSIPEDMALVSFDDIELASALHPFLTVMAQPVRSFGTIAAQLLFERLTGEGPSQPRQVILTPELIVRHSCGARLRQQPA
ncbi:MAG: LacI family DNA-binding transcriptional regulator [Chloroflexota bacterium]